LWLPVLVDPAAPAAGLAITADAVGIVGGGQLALMLAQAAPALGLALHVQTPGADDPATAAASSVVKAPLDDLDATRRLARRCAAISFENEWLDLPGLEALVQEGVRFVPDLASLEPLVSKRRQRELLHRLDLPSPRWSGLEAVLRRSSPAPGPSHSESDGAHSPNPALIEESRPLAPRLPEWLSFPLMAKAASGGYDGKGTRLLRDQSDLEALLLEVDPHTWILEELVPFEMELAQLACRDRDGRVQCYPLVQTHQHRHVCDWVLAPAPVPHAVQAHARNLAASLLTAIGYVGVCSLELFYGPSGLQVNEIAPRTHNAGHFSIEACQTSQFEQQLRIVAGLPPGSVELRLPGALMVNLLGFQPAGADYAAQLQQLQGLESAVVHWYGKRGPGLGRKLGHITLTLESRDAEALVAEASHRLQQVRAIWPLPDQG